MPEKFDANPKKSFMEFPLQSKEGTFHQGLLKKQQLVYIPDARVLVHWLI
jgi:hypothetical protein